MLVLLVKLVKIILGQKYEDGLKKEKVNYLYNKKKEPIPTGSCLILITPDSETNNVYLFRYSWQNK